MLLTSAPVAANSIATIALPLDLHVLSLSLAFILSQDQTLRCVYLSCSFLCEKGHPNGERPAPLLKRLIGYAPTRNAPRGTSSPVTSES